MRLLYSIYYIKYTLFLLHVRTLCSMAYLNIAITLHNSIS